MQHARGAVERTPEDGKQEAISNNPRLIIHWMTTAANNPKTTELGPA